MFILEAHKPGSARVWWAGGNSWSYDETEAALFRSDTMAMATLRILGEACRWPAWQREAKAVRIEQHVDVPDYPDA